MKDFIPRFTFSFLMAQLLPGAIALLFLTLPIVSLARQPVPPPLVSLFDNSLGTWFEIECCQRAGPAPVASRAGKAPDSPGDATDAEAVPGSADGEAGRRIVLKAIVFFFIALGLGMVIHGINWMVLAWLENYRDPDNPTPALETFCHRWRPIWQILVGPVKMVVEIVWAFCCARGVKCLVMQENAPRIGNDRSVAFTFVEELYLPFAQFYAHTAYALLIGLPCLLVFDYATKVRWLPSTAGLLSLYVLTSLLFLTGRVQFSSLFAAENDFLQATSPSDQQVHTPQQG